MKKTKLALIGVYPPPVGGISVHVQRLCDALDERGIAFTLYDNTQGEKDRPVVYTGKIEKWAFMYLFSCREEVIHVHFLRWQVRLLFALLAVRGKRVIFTVHNMRDDGQMSAAKRWVARLTGKLAAAFIVVNPAFVQKLAAYGIDPAKIHYIPPFIPSRRKGAAISAPVQAFLGTGERKLVLANGTIGDFHAGADLHGADLFVSLYEQVTAVRKDVCFIYCITHVVDQAYYERLKHRVAERGLAGHFLFLLAPPEYQTLLGQASVFVRPTSSESYGISVYEALHAGVPVVASDAAERPPQAILFRSRDVDDLTQKVLAVLNGEIVPSAESVETVDYSRQILDLYQLPGRTV